MSNTILVIDDDLDLQTTLCAILEDQGYEALAADDGLSALALLETARPDLILLDMGLPRMDGYAFAGELRRRGLRPQIRVLVLTADGRVREKAAQIEAEGFLAKPFALSELLEEIARLLRQPAV